MSTLRGPRSIRPASIRLLPLLLLTAACGPGDEASEVPPLPAATEQDLLEADRAFARDVAAEGAEAWAAWFAPDGAMVQPGVGEVRGRPDILGAMGSLDDPGRSLVWEPYRAELAASGDLGYTVGRWTATAPAASAGVPAEVTHGLYVTIWRRMDDGSWKVAMDLGNPVGAGSWPDSLSADSGEEP